jgi:hypothetical protein
VEGHCYRLLEPRSQVSGLNKTVWFYGWQLFWLLDSRKPPLGFLMAIYQLVPPTPLPPCLVESWG